MRKGDRQADGVRERGSRYQMMIPSELTSYDKRLRGLGSRGPNERAKGTRGEGKGESWA